MACGFDGLINFYANRDEISNLEIESAFLKHTEWNKKLTTPYFVDASENLMAMFNDIPKGITISAPGFYGPQGRILRINTQDPDLNNKIKSFRFDNKDLQILKWNVRLFTVYRNIWDTKPLLFVQ